MNKYEFIGKTREEAIEQALSELNSKEEDLIIKFEDSNSISNSDIDSWDASAILDDDDDAWLSEL